MRNTVLVLMTVVLSSAYGLVSAFHIEPQTAAQSGWTTHEHPTVAQVITINFDELDSTTGAYCELFAGTKGGGGAYHVSVLTYPGGSPIASGNASGNVDHEWVKFNLGVNYPDSIVKGRKLEFRFTRSGVDSIQYYFDEACGYNYGRMIAPYQSPTAGTGLAARCDRHPMSSAV